MLPSGKAIRLRKIFNRDDGRCVMVPMDHGVTLGPVRGLERMAEAVGLVSRGGADAVVLHKGFIAHCFAALGPSTALIMHLSGGTRFHSRGNSKVLVGSVEEALRYGADGVSIHVSLGDPAEREMLRDFGKVGEAAARWGMPLLAMVYVRDPGAPDATDPACLGHAVRLATELGADIVKIPCCSWTQDLREALAASPIPVLVAGGEKMDEDAQILAFARACMEAGASGLSVGRNVFQHSQPDMMVRALCSVVHQEIVPEP